MYAFSRCAPARRGQNRVSSNKCLRVESLEPRLTFSASPLRNLTFAANADTFVQGGASADVNFGPLPYLTVRQDANANNLCQSLVRFDYGSVNGTLNSAVLRLSPIAKGGALSQLTLRIRLLADANDGWTEGAGGTQTAGGAITWNTRPSAAGTTITVPSFRLIGPVMVDVTSLLSQGLNANRVASFVIDTLTTSGTPAWVSFASRQTASPAGQPTLALSYTPATPTNLPPSVATAASATGAAGTTSVNLAALGADDNGESNLTYTWAVTAMPAGATPPVFSVNGSNAAKNAVATLSQAGTYGFAVKITDAGGLSTASCVGVVVNATLGSITVTPDQASVVGGTFRRFAATAFDQFGNPLLVQPGFAWSATAGTIAPDGTFTAPASSADPVTVTAASAAVSGTATVTVLSQFPTLNDAALANLVQTVVARDGGITRQDMIQILQSVVQTDNLVDATELSDLQIIVANAQTLGMPGYVQVLAGDVVNGSPANASYQGQALGNLAAGSDGGQLNKLVSKWFLGTDHPAAVESTSSTSSVSYTYLATAGRLFPTTPFYTDMHQGAVGDCYLIAALGSIAKSTPAAIKNMFIVNGDGTWTVRFYANGVADYVTVDNMLPCDASGRLVYENEGFRRSDPRNVLWIALAEKAYAQWNETGKEGQNRDGTNTYAGIAGGWMNDVDTQVLGHNAVDYHFASLAEKQTLINSLAANKAVTLGTATGGNGLYGGHAYVVTGYSARTDTFTAYNPWGIDHPGPLTWSQLVADCDVWTIA